MVVMVKGAMVLMVKVEMVVMAKVEMVKGPRVCWAGLEFLPLDFGFDPS